MELVIVIGKAGTNIPTKQALDYVIGVRETGLQRLKPADPTITQYTICNDVSARKRMFGEAALEAEAGYELKIPERAASPQWGMGKSFDGWLPIGPCLLAAHAVKDPQNLRLTTHLSKQPSLNPVQNGNTADMMWQVAETVSALSYGTTLRPGDIICTGTPDGQGSNRKPPVWLQDGEIVTVFGEGIGSLTNRVVFDNSENVGVATVGPVVKAKL